MQIYNLQKKNPLKETKFLQDCHNSIITNNLKFQHKPNYLSSFENPHIKIDLVLLLLPRGQPTSRKLLYSIMNLNTNFV